MAEELTQQEEMSNDGYDFIDLNNLEGISQIEGLEVLPEVPEEEEEVKPKETEQPEDTGDISDGEKPVEGKDNKEDPASLEKDIKKPSPFTPYAKLVQDAGVLPNFDIEKWDGSPEGLIQGMQSEIENGINSYKETFNPQIKWLADNYEAGVPLESLLQVDKQRFELASITDEALGEEATQRDIVKQYYKETTQFPDATIDKAIERLEATGELEEESKGFFEQLKQLNVQKEQVLRQQAEQQQAEAVQQQQAQLAQFKQSLDATDEIVPGVKLNTAMRDKVYNGLTTAVDTNPVTGQPMNEIQKAFMQDPTLETKFAYIWYATNGFSDFKAFGSTGKKSAVAEFENAVKGMDFNQNTQQRVSKPSSDPDLVAQMKNFATQWK